MTLELRLRAEAELDLADAAHWYEEQKSGLGHQFLDEILATFSIIAETPLTYQVVHRNTRRALVQRFPWHLLSSRDQRDRSGRSHAWQPESASLEKPCVALARSTYL